MVQYPTAEKFLPPRLNLKALREAAETCRGCDLYKDATQTVFGEGPRRAPMILLGETPGDEEDKQGKPFVGPAGRLLDSALDEIGLSRDEVYVTNAVKHFRWEPRGKRRLHKKPSARQIEACKPWLHAEILVTKPEVIVTKHRGKFFKSEDAAWLMATYHPSAILRAPDKEDRDRKRAEFVEDLRHAMERLNAHAAAAH
jgi:uracil-DNA glycosylase